ncbi:MAG: FdtA/QdtA family cupin domain-containing protein [Gammaproteobacteria bacterium]|nr:FdtA/QdtA family cupin domain-containing protein [Gammaproteobacteria bacterium]
MDVRWIELERKSDERGQLLIAEAQKNIPFEIRRVYCLYGMDTMPRGFHAHKHLQQVMVCLAGQCNVLLDNGISNIKVSMDNTKQGLFIDKMIWREMMDFSKDCVLMVIANAHYEENDYIRDHEAFKALSVQCPSNA